MSNFKPFALAIAAQFALMQQHSLVRVDADPDTVWACYLAAFPSGSNPIFRVRTEHDGSYDRNFLKKLGNVVALTEDGQVITIWDAPSLQYPYKEVCERMADWIRRCAITGAFRHNERKVGYVSSTEKLDDGQIRTWNHFHADIADRYFDNDVAATLGTINTTVQMTLRAFAELTDDAIQTVLDLIDNGSLYKGKEFRDSVRQFQNYKKLYDKRGDREKQILVWLNSQNMIGRIRNTAIGTLITDLSEGMDVERAVKAYETKTAPENYKRPTSLITKGMAEQAAKTIQELGLEPSLQRRGATIQDVSINNVLWAADNVRGAMRDTTSAAALLMSAAVAKPNNKLANAVNISMEEFIASVLPKATGMSVLFKNKMRNQLMTITTASDSSAPLLFKWDNAFAWSYNGNIADSQMRQAVEARGGSVSGVFRFTHQWNYGKRNASLMDLHVFLPGHNTANHPDGFHDMYGNEQRIGWNHRRHMPSGGVQDVDYTNPAPSGYVPVENITFPTSEKMPDGVYTCKIHNWHNRVPTEGGFKAEIEFGGEIFEYEVDRALKQKEWMTVARVTKAGDSFSIEHVLPCGSAPQRIWNIQTEGYVPVSTLMLSPNYWDDNSTGNKHWFFILENCYNEDPARGIYNEFLRPELEVHRKAFEILGDKTKIAPSPGQLSGLGFSHTRRDSVTVQVTGPTINQTYNVSF